MISTRHTLSKKERLSGKTAVSALMSKGVWSGVSGMKYCHKADNGLDYNRIIVSVPKKFFKRAVVRNLLKRRIREAYRMQKDLLQKESGIDILFLYNSSEIMSSGQIFEMIGRILSQMK